MVLRSSILALALATLAVVPASAGRDVRTSIDVGGQIVDGSRATQAVAGRIVIATPEGWRRTTRNGSRSARFAAHESADCVGHVNASPRATATSNGALAQARRVTRFPLALIGEGHRPGGAWRAVDVKDPPGGRPLVYGIAVVRIARARWIDLRVFVTYDGCSPQQVERGSVAAVLKRVLREAEMRVGLVPFHRP